MQFTSDFLILFLRGEKLIHGLILPLDPTESEDVTPRDEGDRDLAQISLNDLPAEILHTIVDYACYRDWETQKSINLVNRRFHDIVKCKLI